MNSILSYRFLLSSLFYCIALMIVLPLNARASVEEKPAGFLWYNIKQETQKLKEKKRTKPGIPFGHLSFTDQDAILRFYTMEALHKARQTKKVEDMKAFLSLQDYWLKESSHFSSLFQKTLLLYPQYDYTVTHPMSNLGVKLTDSLREQNRIQTIKRLAQSHGLLFFYRGSNPYDAKQIPIIKDFTARFNLALIPISIDGETSELLPSSREDKGQADALGVHYFPALLLVNPKTKKTLPVAYGLTTQDVLEKRLTQVAQNFKGEI